MRAAIFCASRSTAGMAKHFHLGIRTAWLVLGLAALACGIAGIVLPLVPTTPFILLAAFAFARSSPRLSNWIVSHAHFGPLIENWQRHGAISRRAKVYALVTIALTPLITWLIGAPGWALAAQIGVLVLVAAFIATRPSVGAAYGEARGAD
jgi:uncharacterized membrane protein YbaN (DUF454 family)